MSVLITGGVKSGKSSHALRMSGSWTRPSYFLVTAVAFDEEMRKKGSSVKSVGRFGLGELAKCMIQGNLRGLKGSETIGFSHSDFYFVV